MPDDKKRQPQKRAFTVNSQWMQNTLKSLGLSATGALTELMPATAGTIKSGATVATDTARAIRNTKGVSRQVQNAIKNNPLVKTGQDFFKNAITDIKSGNWHEECLPGDEGDMFNDLDTMFGDLDDMADGSDSNIDVDIENNIQPESSVAIRAIEKQTEYQVKSAQATVDTMVSIGSASLMKAEEIGNKVVSELTNINTTLNALLTYNNDNVTKFIEASIGYYDQMMIKPEESTSGQKIDPENIYGEKGLDFSTYKSYIKQNIEAIKGEGEFQTISMFMEMLPEMVANPIDMVTKWGVQKLIPEVTKTAMAKLDQSMKDFIPWALDRISGFGEGEDGMMGTVKRYIGRIFGVKAKAETNLDFSDIKTGPVPFNGKANHTIIEIIPKYLRESNNYLRVIAEELTGRNAEDLEDEVTGFDWTTGRFKSIGQMKDEQGKDYETQVLSGAAGSEFGKRLQQQMAAVFGDKFDVETYQKLLNQMMLINIQREKNLDFGQEGALDEFIGQIQAGDDEKNFLKAFFEKERENNSEVLGNFNAISVAMRNRSNQYIKGLTNEANLSNNTQIHAGHDKDQEDLLQQQIERNAIISPVLAENARTADDYKARIDTIESERLAGLRNEEEQQQSGSIRQQAGQAAAKPLNAFAGVLNSIMAGNADAAWDNLMQGFGKVFERAGQFLGENFFNPIKDALFGKKRQDGYIDGGIFGGVNNRMKESFFSLRRMITGKGYKDAEGNDIPDANEEEMKNTVVGKLKSSVAWMKDAISIRLFGEKDEEGNYKKDENGKDKDGLMGKTKRGIEGATSSLLKGITGWKHALFGKSDGEDEDEEVEGKKILEDLKKKAAEVAPSAMTGAIGGGLLGMFVGGPVGGALLGLAGGIASKSDRFKEWLFGKDNEDGSHTEGLIKKSTQDYFRKNGKFLAGGALLGAIKGTIFPGAGLLTSLVGGPVAGAITGLATSVLLKSDMFQKFWFGDEKTGQLGMKQNITRWMRKLGMNADTGDASGGKLAGMMAIGAGAGGLLGMVVGGPVIGALGGLSLSILAQKENFKEWLFGSVDEKTGEKKEGVLGKFKNMLSTEVFTPISNAAANIVDDFKTWFRFDVLGKVNLIMERLGDSFFGAVSKITGTAMASVADFGNFIKENFLDNMVDNLGKLFAPITKAASTIAQGVYSAGKAIISAPINIMMGLLSPAVSAITNVIGTVGGAMVKTVDLVLVKPVKNLILKPLGAAIGLASKVIAAPFKMIAGAFDWINNTFMQAVGHVQRFFSAIGDHIKTSINQNIITPIKKGVQKTMAKVANFFLRPIDRIVGLAKDMFTIVGEFAKEKISGFFKQALNLMNPLTWIRGVARLGSSILNIITGGRVGKGPISKPERSGEPSWLAKLWEETKTGTGKDYSSRMIYKKNEDGSYALDKDGNRIIEDTTMSYAQRVKALREARNAQRSVDKNTRHERKEVLANQRMIRKYTKNQRFDDTDENRALAEAAAGHKLNWGSVAAKKTDFEQKSLDYAEDSLNVQGEAKDYLKDIAAFILGGKFRTHDPEEIRQAKIKAEEDGKNLQEKRDKRQAKIQETAQGLSFHARQDAKDMKAVDKRLRQRENNARKTQVKENYRKLGLFGSLSEAFSFSAGRKKAGQDDEIPANAAGTEGAKPGLSIVGEKGPEVVYEKDAKFGRFVGLGGPEVIKMKGGETVIPNNRIPRYENGVGNFDIFKSIKNIPMIVLQPVSSAVNVVAKAVTAPFKLITDIVTAPFRMISNSITGVFTRMGDNIQDKVDSVVEGTLHMLNPLTWIKGFGSSLKDIGSSAVDFLWGEREEPQGINEGVAQVADITKLEKTEPEAVEGKLASLLGGGSVGSDDDIMKATDTSKMSVGARILRSINEIKVAILEKVVGSSPKEAPAVGAPMGDTSMEDLQEMSADGTVPEAFGATLNPISIGGSEKTSTDMVDDGMENSQADQEAAQATVSGKTGEVMSALKQAEREEEDKRNWMQKMLDHLKGTHDETKKHGISWDSIFSKKGLITAGLLAGLPLLWNFIKNFKFTDILSSIGEKIKDFLANIHINFTIGEVLGNITDNIKDALSHFLPFLNNDDSDNTEDPVTAGINAAGALIDAQVNSKWDLANPFTNVYHNRKDGAGDQIVNSVATRAKNNMMFWQPLKNGFVNAAMADIKYGNAMDALAAANKYTSREAVEQAISWRQYELSDTGLSPEQQQVLWDADPQLQELNKQRQNLVDMDDAYDEAQISGPKGALASIGRQVGRVGVLTAGSSLVGKGASGIAAAVGADENTQQMVGNLATAGTAAALTVDFVHATVTGKSSLIDKVLDLFIKFMTNMAKLLKADTTIAKFADKVDGILGSITGAVKKNITEPIAKKICSALGVDATKQAMGAVTLGIGIAVSALDGLASGLCSVEHLFQVLPGDADALMSTISGLLQAVFHALEMTPVVGTAVAMIDILDTILTGVLGMGMKQFIAQNLYCLIGGDREALTTLQAKFRGELDYYNDTYGVDLNVSAFNDMVNNTSWVDKLLHGSMQYDDEGHLMFDEAGGQIERGLIGMVVGGEKSYVKDEFGNVVRREDGSAVVAKDAYGNTIKKNEKWGDKVGQTFNAIGRWFAGGDTYEVDENGQAIWDAETQSFKVASHQGNVLQRAGDWLLGGKETYYTDDNGNTYTVNEDGSYTMTAADGTTIGTLNEQQMEARKWSLTEQTQRKGGALAAAGEWVSDGMAVLGETLSGAGKAIMDNAGKAWNLAKDGWKWLTTREATDGFINPIDNTYYLPNGEHYTMNGELIETVGLDVLSSLVATGQIDGPVEIVTKDFGPIQMWKDARAAALKGLANAATGALEWGKGMLDKAKDLGSKAMTALKNTGESIKNYWTSHPETAWYDTDGSYYTIEGDTVYHRNGNGSLIGTITPEDFETLLALGQFTEGEAMSVPGIMQDLSNFQQKMSQGWSNFKSSASEHWSNFTEKAGQTWDKAKTAVSNFATNVRNYWTSHPEVAWYDTDGSYWTVEGDQAYHRNATGSLIGEPISAEEFDSMLATGQFTEGTAMSIPGIMQDLQSFGQKALTGWNNFKEKASAHWDSFKEKAGSVIGKAMTTVNNIRNFWSSHNEKRYYDSEGGYYQTNGTTFDYYNQNGDIIKEGISADEFRELLQAGIVTEDDTEIVRVKSGFSGWLKDVTDSGYQAFNKWKDSAKAMWAPVVEKAGAAFDAIKKAGGPAQFIGGLFTKKTTKVWYDTNGNYYKMESNGKYSKFNMNGDLLEENLDADKIQSLAEAGVLTEGDLVEDSDAQKAVKEIQSAVSEAWSAAKNTVKSGWESFKNWITGGSGSGNTINQFTQQSRNSMSAPGGSGYGIQNQFIPGGKGDGEPSTLNGVPYYSQNDSRWANNAYEPLSYSDGATMGNTGCGPTAMSMVLGKMGNDKPTPPELAAYAQFTGTRDETGTNWNFIDSAASTYGLNSVRSINPDSTFITENLKSGNPMILSGQSDNSGPYTQAGHYIVATSADSNGNITYNDPRGSVYSGRMNIDDFINNTGAAWTFLNEADMPHGSFGLSSISNRKNTQMRQTLRGGKGLGVTSSDVIAVAQNEIGYVNKKSNSDLDNKTANAKGSGSGYTKYSRDTGLAGNPNAWCAMFVCWCVYIASNKDKSIAKQVCRGGYSASCTTIMKAFKSAGAFLSKNAIPQPGDFVLFNWDNGNDTSYANHIGLVVGVSGDKVITIEGNTSGGNQKNGGHCERKERNRKNINGFCRPAYDDVSNFTGVETYVDSGTSLTTTAGATVSTTSMGATDALSLYTTMMGQIANAGFNAAMTGDMNIDWDSVFAGNQTTTGITTTDSTGVSTDSGTVSGGVVDPGDINERTQKVIQFFRSKGLSDAQIAGILGCWKAESGVTPGKVEGYYLKGYPSGLNYAKDRSAVDNFTVNTLFPAYARSGISIKKNAYKGDDGHYYPGVGLAQWTGSRGKTYADLFAEKGYSFGDIVPELEMVWKELSPGGVRSYVLGDFKATTTPESAAEVFCRKYEGYGVAKGISERQGYARTFYNNMSSIAAGTGGGAGEGTDDSGVPYELSGIKLDASAEGSGFSGIQVNPTVSIHTPFGEFSINGGSGDGSQYETPVIASNRKYSSVKKGGRGPSKAPVRSSINIRTAARPGSHISEISPSGGYGPGYDDTNVVRLMNQMVEALNALNNTGSKQLDALNGILDSNGQPINLQLYQGGDTTVNSTNIRQNNPNTRRSQFSTSVSRAETRARTIAGL